MVPLDRSLLVRKQALEAALAAYARATDYLVAPVATAADFAMADLYRDFGRALLDSERPHNLSTEELEQYDLLLEEQAFPFEEKAIAIHERNTRRAAEGSYDEWVRRSYAALAELKPGRYARVERDAGVDRPRSTSGHWSPVPCADPPGAGHFNRLGIAYRQAGRFADARAAYEQAIAADPALADAECNLAILFDLYLDDPEAALPHFERYQALTGRVRPAGRCLARGTAHTPRAGATHGGGPAMMCRTLLALLVAVAACRSRMPQMRRPRPRRRSARWTGCNSMPAPSLATANCPR